MGTGFPTNTILQNFETGDKPTQDQFAQFINGVGTIDDNSPLNNLSASTAPLPTDDSNSGYSVGSRWIDTATSTEYVCMSATTGNAVWAALSTTGGGATVTSVGLSMPVDLFSVSGSPVTTTGVLSASKVSQSANRVFAGPTTGAAAAPTFRALVSNDIPLQPQKVVFTSNGTFTTPADTTLNRVFKVTITGAGAASNFAVAGSGRGGAGAGATAIKYVSGLSPSTGYAIVIGTAPAGYSGSNGGNSTATFDSLVITAGGGIAPVGPPDNVPGSGGTATNGDINIPGGNGCPGVVGTNGVGGQGGASYWGGGPSAGYAASVGTGTTGAPGSGASGLAASGSGGGGFGFNGICIIEWLG